MAKRIHEGRWQIRRDRLIILLPKHKWEIVPAAIEAGYSKYYAKTRLPTILKDDVSFCKAVEEAKARLTDKVEITVDIVLRGLEDLLLDPASTGTVKVKCRELQGRYLAMWADKQIIDDNRRERELTEAEQAEAKRYAIWSLHNKGKTG